MSIFVLLHGAWHGGWDWQRVAPALRTVGHEVYSPTLTGLQRPRSPPYGRWTGSVSRRRPTSTGSYLG
ncbi:alpha/beta fold hydrolase [Streptomyces griseorubiginosus]|uniref:alpha/beta fold hydrolase n=1 Tax=Streptomyces griseorubiginosus TaxID=67304 RepID=UPI0034D790D9